MDRRTRYLMDFSIASVIVLAANTFTISSIDVPQELDRRGFSLLVGLLSIDSFPPEERFALAIFGDSRSQPRDGDNFCSVLPPASGNCVNASSTSGDWVTVYLLFEKMRPHLENGAPLLVFLSDYWFEGPTLSLIRGTYAYYDLNEILLTVESNLRMSAMRSIRMNWFHERLTDLANALKSTLTDIPPLDEKTRTGASLEEIYRSNVDRWFAPIDDDTRARSERIGTKVLMHMKSAGHPVTLIYLPNLRERDEYVDLRYPGRRERFHSTLRGLASAGDIRLVDLSTSVTNSEYFRDFHHLNAEGRKRVARILARDLTRAGVLEGPSPAD